MENIRVGTRVTRARGKSYTFTEWSWHLGRSKHSIGGAEGVKDMHAASTPQVLNMFVGMWKEGPEHQGKSGESARGDPLP